jgi:hypothetical protein
MTSSNSKDMFETAVRYETKRLLQQRRVSKENIILHRSDDLLRQEVVLCVELLCNGLEDKKEFKRTSEGRVPTTLFGLVKRGLHSKLARHRFGRWLLTARGHWLRRALERYPSVPVITNNYETWNVCPHGDHKRDCERFLSFGGDFASMNENAKGHANDIVREAVKLSESSGMQDVMSAQHRLLRTAYLYKRARGV